MGPPEVDSGQYCEVSERYIVEYSARFVRGEVGGL